MYTISDGAIALFDPAALTLISLSEIDVIFAARIPANLSEEMELPPANKPVPLIDTKVPYCPLLGDTDVTDTWRYVKITF